jgi:hypothetical protein
MRKRVSVHISGSGHCVSFIYLGKTIHTEYEGQLRSDSYILISEIDYNNSEILSSLLNSLTSNSEYVFILIVYLRLKGVVSRDWPGNLKS